MKEKKATEIFSQWVLDGKDEGMEKNHSDAVNVMLDEIIGSQTVPFLSSMLDAVMDGLLEKLLIIHCV